MRKREIMEKTDYGNYYTELSIDGGKVFEYYKANLIGVSDLSIEYDPFYEKTKIEITLGVKKLSYMALDDLSHMIHNLRSYNYKKDSRYAVFVNYWFDMEDELKDKYLDVDKDKITILDDDDVPLEHAPLELIWDKKLKDLCIKGSGVVIADRNDCIDGHKTPNLLKVYKGLVEYMVQKQERESRQLEEHVGNN